MTWQHQLHQREKLIAAKEQELEQRQQLHLAHVRAHVRCSRWGPIVLLGTLERVALEGLQGEPGALQRAAQKVARLWLAEWQQAAQAAQGAGGAA